VPAIDQVAVVVRDLDAAMRQYSEKLGIGGWDVYTYGPHCLHTMTFRGEERPYVMKLALARVGGTAYELIESVEGPNIYEEFLTTRGEGLHHLGYYVEDIDRAIEEMAARGYGLLQSGRGFGTENDGAYAYFDTERDFGCILEAIELPPALREPERRFPG
jgi:catechol 2,3-dioxygenase-like lactoylglutathione lyase family enzyme